MNATEFIECLNAAFRERFPDKGHFVVIEQYANDTPMPIYKHYIISLYYIPTKDRVLTVSAKERVPKEKKAAFEQRILQKFVYEVIRNIDKIYGFGVQ